WDFNGRAVPGSVRVMPVIAPTDVQLDDETWVGAGLSELRQDLRRERESMATDIPASIASALPGAINGRVGASWGGEFSVGRYRMGARRRLEHHVGALSMVPALTDAATRGDSASTLFIWVEEVSANPLSAETFAGDIVVTEVGPVVVDHQVEPYRVSAKVGAALVASDGQIVVRYVDHFEAVLTDRGPSATGRMIAQGLADELSLVWPSDERLMDGMAFID
ncbi:MAG: hypothetical protein ACJATT_005982, partial [Myxococcota bacterium]